MIRNTEDFINEVENKWPNKFDFSKTNYINSRTQLILICKEHGEFNCKPLDIKKKFICPRCNEQYNDSPYKYKMNLNDWIQRFKHIHGDRYDYSLITEQNYKDNKIPIICKEHGVFYQMKRDHSIGKGCRQCNATSHHGSQKNLINEHIPFHYIIGKEYCRKLTKEIFLQRAKDKYGDKFDYSNVKYIDRLTPVNIVCKKHGEFQVTPKQHLNSCGCPGCCKENRAKGRTLTYEKWLEECKKTHGNKYDYSKVNYNTGNDYVEIICPKHGSFFQKASNHRYGQGCPKCMESHLEKEIRVLCEQNNIKYEYQKQFKWLGNLRLDFYFPDYQIAIECQGEQHFKLCTYFDNEETFKQRQERDQLKYKLCLENNIRIFYFSNKKYKNCITNKNQILKLFSL